MGGLRGVIVALVFVAMASMLDLRVALRSNGPQFEADVMREAQALVKKTQKPGDIQVFSPLFRASEVAALELSGASSFLPAAKLRKTRRVVLVERVDQPMYGFGAPTETFGVTTSDGQIEVRLYEPVEQGEVALWSLYDNIAPNIMRVERQGAITSRCNQARGEGGFMCPGEPEWLYIAQRSLKIGEEESRCVWAHPTTGGVIVFELPASAEPLLGYRLLIDVAGGLTDDAVRTTNDGAMVRIEVVQNGANIGQVSVANRVGWQKGTFGIAPAAPLELRITTPHDGRRHFCLNAEIKSEVQK